MKVSTHTGVKAICMLSEFQVSEHISYMDGQQTIWSKTHIITAITSPPNLTVSYPFAISQECHKCQTTTQWRI